MNIFQKISEIRAKILSLNLKKSGKSEFANFSYYELSDFLPATITLEHELGITSLFEVKGEKGELLIINNEKPDDRHLLTIDIREANAKGMLEIQKVGAENTYGKRYAYMNYLNLTDNDSVDSLNQKEKIDKTKKEKQAEKVAPTVVDVFADDSEKVKAIQTIDTLLGGNPEHLQKWLTAFGTSYADLTPSVADTIIAQIKKRQAEKKAKDNA